MGDEASEFRPVRLQQLTPPFAGNVQDPVDSQIGGRRLIKNESVSTIPWVVNCVVPKLEDSDRGLQAEECRIALPSEADQGCRQDGSDYHDQPPSFFLTGGF